MSQAPERPAVELRPAFVWDCPECGEELFVRGLVPEMSEEDLQELRDEQGVQPWELGDFVMMPENVQCRKCGASFCTLGFRDP